MKSCREEYHFIGFVLKALGEKAGRSPARLQEFKADKQRSQGGRLTVTDQCPVHIAGISVEIFFPILLGTESCARGRRLKLYIQSFGYRATSGHEEVIDPVQEKANVIGQIDHSCNASRRSRKLKVNLGSIKLSSCFAMALNRASVRHARAQTYPSQQH